MAEFKDYLESRGIDIYNREDIDFNDIFNHAVSPDTVVLSDIDGNKSIEIRAAMHGEEFRVMAFYKDGDNVENQSAQTIDPDKDYDKVKEFTDDIFGYLGEDAVRADQLEEGESIESLKNDYEAGTENEPFDSSDIAEGNDYFSEITLADTDNDEYYADPADPNEPIVIDEDSVPEPVITDEDFENARDNADETGSDAIYTENSEDSENNSAGIEYRAEDRPDADSDNPAILENIPLPDNNGDTVIRDKADKPVRTAEEIQNLPEMEKIESLTRNETDLMGNGVISGITKGKDAVLSRDNVASIRESIGSFGKVMDGRIDTMYSVALNTGKGLNDSVAGYLQVPAESVAYINVRVSREPYSETKDRQLNIDVDGTRIKVAPEINLVTFETQMKGNPDKIYQSFLVDNIGRIQYEVPVSGDKAIGVSNGEENGTMRFNFMDITDREYIEPMRNADNPICQLERDESGKLATDKYGNPIIERDEDGYVVQRFGTEEIAQIREELGKAIDGYKEEVALSIYDKLEEREQNIETDYYTQESFRDIIAENYDDAAMEYAYAAGQILQHGYADVKDDDKDHEGIERLSISDISKEMGRLNDHLNAIDSNSREGMEIKDKIDNLREYLVEAVKDYAEAGEKIEINGESIDFKEIAERYRDAESANKTAEFKLFTLRQEVDEVKELRATPPSVIVNKFEALMMCNDRLDPGIEKFSVPKESGEERNVSFKEELVSRWNAQNGNENKQLYVTEDGKIYSQYGFRVDSAEMNLSSSDAYSRDAYFDSDRINTDIIDISATALFENADGSFEKESIDRYAGTRVEGSDTSIFDIRDEFMDFVRGGTSQEDVEKLGYGIDNSLGYQDKSLDVLSDIGGNTDYSKNLRGWVGKVLETYLDITYLDMKDALSPVNIIRDIAQDNNNNDTEKNPGKNPAAPFTKNDIENLARNVDRHGSGRINQDKVINGKPVVELSDKIKNIPADRMEKLEKIADKIMGYEKELSFLDKVYGNPSVSHRDKDYQLLMHNRDSLIHKYEKLGGKVGEGCFVEKGVSRFETFLEFVSFWNADPYLTLIMKVVYRGKYQELEKEMYKNDTDKDKNDTDKENNNDIDKSNPEDITNPDDDNADKEKPDNADRDNDNADKDNQDDTDKDNDNVDKDDPDDTDKDDDNVDKDDPDDTDKDDDNVDKDDSDDTDKDNDNVDKDDPDDTDKDDDNVDKDDPDDTDKDNDNVDKDDPGDTDKDDDNVDKDDPDDTDKDDDNVDKDDPDNTDKDDDNVDEDDPDDTDKGDDNVDEDDPDDNDKDDDNADRDDSDDTDRNEPDDTDKENEEGTDKYEADGNYNDENTEVIKDGEDAVTDDTDSSPLYADEENNEAGSFDKSDKEQDAQDQKTENAAAGNAVQTEPKEYDNEKIVDDIKERINNVIAGNDNIEDTFLNAVANNDITSEELNNIIEDVIGGRGDIAEANPEDIAAIFNHAAEISESPEKTYEELNEVLGRYVDGEYLDTVENSECDYLENTPYESSIEGEVLDITFNERGETPDSDLFSQAQESIANGNFIEAGDILSQIEFDQNISSVEWSDAVEAIKEALAEHGIDKEIAQGLANDYMEEHDDLDSFDLNEALDFFSQSFSLDENNDIAVQQIDNEPDVIEIPEEFNEMIDDLVEIMTENGMDMDDAVKYTNEYIESEMAGNPEFSPLDMSYSDAVDSIFQLQSEDNYAVPEDNFSTDDYNNDIDQNTNNDFESGADAGVDAGIEGGAEACMVVV